MTLSRFLRANAIQWEPLEGNLPAAVEAVEAAAVATRRSSIYYRWSFYVQTTNEVYITLMYNIYLTLKRIVSN